MGIPLLFVGLGSLICFIIVLVKQFQNSGVVQGLVGIITCGLWTFVWGWIKSGRYDFRVLMIIWTTLVIVQIILMNISRCYSPWTPFFMC